MVSHIEALLEKIDRLMKEMGDIRRGLLKVESQDKREEAWDNLMRLSEEVSAKWQGPSAVDEIKAQRDKGYP